MALTGCRICVTGTHSLTRSELQGAILAAGGEFAKTVGGKTTHVLATTIEVANSTSKVAGARKHKIPIVNEAWFEACKAQGSPVADLSPYLLDGGSGPAAVQPSDSFQQ